MKRILINATQREELRVAIVDGQKLHDLDIETAAREQKKGNVYKGRITRVEPSLEACFIDYGADRHGFLPLKEISRDYFKTDPGNGRVNIKEVVSEGQELIVQIDKEERGTKGAALTTFISLAGRFLVLMPNNPRAGGVSRRIEGEDRDDARQTLAEVKVPDAMGMILRTNGIGRSSEEVQWDLDYLVEIWQAIDRAAGEKKAPFLIYQESNIILRALRDYMRPDIGEIVVDNEDVFERAKAHMEHVMPKSVPRLKFYSDTTPLFSRFQVESQIESAHQRTVSLPSGGSIVIDHTEALTSIDINSARATGGASIEETALNTNLEAADEVARQLRLRDLGGLVVIDFIDMNANKNQREVENRLRKAVDIDRARIQLGRISRFGLLEMSRQRLRPSLGEHTQLPCPRCSGQGHIRSIESLALSILRLIEEECMKDKTARVVAQLPVEVATFLLNEKRINVARIEHRHKAQIVLVPNEALKTPHYHIERIRGDQLEITGADPSYTLAQEHEEREQDTPASTPKPISPAEPAVKSITPSRPAPSFDDEAAEPAKAASSGPSLWQRILAWFSSDDDDKDEESRPRREPRKGSKSAKSARGDGSGRRKRGAGSKDRDGRGRGGRSQDGRGRRGEKSRGDADKRRNDKAAAGNDAAKAQEATQDKAQDRPQDKRSGGDEDSRGSGTGNRRRRRRGGRNRNRGDKAARADGDNNSANDDKRGNGGKPAEASAAAKPAERDAGSGKRPAAAEATVTDGGNSDKPAASTPRSEGKPSAPAPRKDEPKAETGTGGKDQPAPKPAEPAANEPAAKPRSSTATTGAGRKGRQGRQAGEGRQAGSRSQDGCTGSGTECRKGCEAGCSSDTEHRKGGEAGFRLEQAGRDQGAREVADRRPGQGRGIRAPAGRQAVERRCRTERRRPSRQQLRFRGRGMHDAPPIDRLRAAIGRRALLDDEAWRLRDVLSEGPVLVLESLSARSVQSSAYGEAHRRVPRTLEIDLSSEQERGQALLIALGLPPEQ